MSVQDTARQLGKELLETEQAKRLIAANEAFKASEEAIKMINDYNDMQRQYQYDTTGNKMPKEEMEKRVDEIMMFGEKIKKDPICGELINAQNDFNRFMNSVLAIIKQTIE